jgi:hypothetical protein
MMVDEIKIIKPFNWPLGKGHEGELHVWQAVTELTEAIYSVTGEEAFQPKAALKNRLRATAAVIVTTITEALENIPGTTRNHHLRVARDWGLELHRDMTYARSELSLNAGMVRGAFDRIDHFIQSVHNLLEKQTSRRAPRPNNDSSDS